MGKYKIIPSSRTIVQSPISIGHKAEKGVEAIEFDLTAWVETYGSGTLTVIMRRWGDAIPYPIALEIDENNKATWTLSDTDTAKAGMAYAQLSYIVGETVVKKSDIYTFRVMDSLTGEGEPPEAYESWLEHLTHLAAEAMAEVLDIEGVVTDKTLTVDGGIADAKAAGDALALKADKSTTYTKTEVDKMIEDVEVETDTTLEIAGAPADAAETGRQIGLIKADLDNIQPLTDPIKNTLLNCFAHVAWIDQDGQNYYDALEAALYPYPEWGDDYTWLYNPSDDGLLSGRTDIVATTIGTGCVESLNNGILNLYVPENTSQIIRYNLNQSTNSNAKMTAKVRFKDVPIVTGAAGFRLQVSNGVSGTQIMEHRLRNQDPVFAYLESDNVILLNDIVTFDEWHIISVELNNNKQIITVDGVKVAESSTLSTNYCTLNSIIAQNIVDASNEHEVDVDIAWITYKNND